MAVLALLALLTWIVILVRPGQPWSTREQLGEPAARADLSGVTVLIPARNEADVIAHTLGALDCQGEGLTVVVIDDRSQDSTGAGARAAQLASGQLVVLDGSPRPAGWAGKLWALEQGMRHVETPRLLLLDADIVLAPGVLATLLHKLDAQSLALVSIMARLPTVRFWERLLVPAYVYFFKLWYPFAGVNRPGSRVAAAAGGCVLLDTAALRAIGGFSPIRDQLIDDCALAARVKGAGYSIWLGLSDQVVSQRGYPHLEDFWNMVARSAFTQLDYGIWKLLLCSATMLMLFLAPVLALFGSTATVCAGVASLALMAGTYLPMVRFYGLPGLRAATLPAAALLFLLMTWSSAFRYWRGTRALWKNRVYGVVE